MANVYLHSHHINSYDVFINERFELNNGITLCQKCHDKFHTIYGHGKNTKFQFNEFVKVAHILKNIAKSRHG